MERSLRTQPYVCATCGNPSKDTGIPVLTMNGVEESYVRPYNWCYIKDDFICEKCAVLRAREIEKIEKFKRMVNLLREVTDKLADSRSVSLDAAAELIAITAWAVHDTGGSLENLNQIAADCFDEMDKG